MNKEEKPLVNRVAESGLVTIKLENYFPEEPLLRFDLKDYLFMELILKEKEFREALKAHDWTQYSGTNLLVYCSSDAIIPVWAFMLVAAYAEPYAKTVFQGTEEAFYTTAFIRAIDQLDPPAYQDQRVVIKGCSDRPVPPSAYVELTRRLRPFAQSIMFGEPCSTVPIFKRPRKI
ncbi:MAG: DUF2480 family protein [Lewinellaceae bacterium]|nr:DUF2480 family protein [Lewinellaceae bacterium]